MHLASRRHDSVGADNVVKSTACEADCGIAEQLRITTEQLVDTYDPISIRIDKGGPTAGVKCQFDLVRQVNIGPARCRRDRSRWHRAISLPLGSSRN